MGRGAIAIVSLIGGFLFLLEGSKYLITHSPFFGWFNPAISLPPGLLGYALTLMGMALLIITSILILDVKGSRWLALTVGILILPFYPLGTALGILYLIILMLIWRKKG